MKLTDKLLIAFSVALILLTKIATAQPTPNICDSAAISNASTFPETATGISFDAATKILTTQHIDTPNAYLVTKYYAFKYHGTWANVLVWWGLQCDDTFYDYYLPEGSQLQAQGGQYIQDITGIRVSGNNKVYLRYSVSEVNGGTDYYYRSTPIFTNYLQP